MECKTETHFLTEKESRHPHPHATLTVGIRFLDLKEPVLTDLFRAYYDVRNRKMHFSGNPPQQQRSFPMNPISLVMFIFSAALLLVAAIIYSGDTGLVRSMKFTKVKNKKAYAKFLGKSLAAIALALCAAGVMGLFLPVSVSVITAAVLLVILLSVTAKRSAKYYK